MVKHLLLWSMLAILGLAQLALAAPPADYTDPVGYPTAWPSQMTTTPYTRFGTNENDVAGGSDDSRSATPQSAMDFSSGPLNDQPSFYYYGNGSVLFFRLRLAGPPTALTGSGQPFNSYTWNILLDIDGDGYKEFVIELDGTSTSVAPDDLLVNYDNNPSELFTIGAANIWRQDCARHPTDRSRDGIDGEPGKSDDWDSDPAPYVWDFGRTRVVQIDQTKPVGSQNSEYWLDIQIPMAALDASAMGGPALGPNNPFSISATSSASNTDPTQKDLLYQGSFVLADTPLPGGDTTTGSGQTITGPVIAGMSATACPSPVTLSATVLDTLIVVNGAATNNITGVLFEFYPDLNQNGLADDAQSWAAIGNATSVTNLSTFMASWNTANLPQGKYLVRATATDGQGLSAISTAQTVPGPVFALFTNTCGTRYDLQIKKSAAATVSATSNLVYTISVTNAGPGTAIGVSATDTLPTNTTILSASAGGIWNAGIVTWNLGTLTNRASTNLTLTISAPALAGNFTNWVRVGPTNAETVLANNTNYAVTTVTGIADLQATKTGPTNVFAGTNFSYVLAITNLGPSTASNIVVTDALTPMLSVTSANGGSVTSSNVTWAIAWLAPGTGTNLTLGVRAPASGAVTNTVKASAATTDPNPANNDGSATTAKVTTTVTPLADVRVSKAGPASAVATSNVVYTISVTNVGPSTASNITVVDWPQPMTAVVDAGGGTVGATNITWTLARLNAGASATLTLTLQAPANNILTNWAWSSALTADPDPTNNNGSSTNAVVQTRISPLADLAVGQSGPASVSMGQTAVYTLTVTNLGPSTASNLLISESLGTNLTFVSASGGGSLSGTTVRWTIVSLNAGAITNLTVNTLAGYVGWTTNQASCTSDTSDPNGANNNAANPGAAVTTQITAPGATISGYVYNDANNNGMRDGNEAGTGLSLYAKLVAAGTPSGPALQAAAVNGSSGAYNLSNVTSGTYTIIVNGTSSLSDVTPSLPSGWVGTEMGSLVRSNVVVGTVDVPNQNFGLRGGSTITGRVFEDNGLGGGTGGDGIQNGTEGGISGVTVKLSNSSGNTSYAQVTTDGAGNFVLALPAGIVPGTALRITAVSSSGWLALNGSPGTTGGTYDQASETVTFTFAAATSYTGVGFGRARSCQLTTDGQQNALPGAVLFYRHQFIAGSTGQVSFATSAVSQPGIGGWNQVLYLDANGNGQIDPGENPVSGSITLPAGGQLSLILKQYVPVGAPMNASHVATLTATFTYSASNPVLSDLARSDTTLVGATTSSGLTLQKNVDKTNARPGETLTYTISYGNQGVVALTNIVICDTTPAFTSLVNANHGDTPAGITGVGVTSPGAGGKGPIKWALQGNLPPGAAGTVVFSVSIDQ